MHRAEGLPYRAALVGLFPEADLSQQEYQIKNEGYDDHRHHLSEGIDTSLNTSAVLLCCQMK